MIVTFASLRTLNYLTMSRSSHDSFCVVLQLVTIALHESLVLAEVTEFQGRHLHPLLKKGTHVGLDTLDVFEGIKERFHALGYLRV